MSADSAALHSEKKGGRIYQDFLDGRVARYIDLDLPRPAIGF
ncbi:hypothetical protein [Bradyrhizobium sp. CSA207]|nr:hypothetical protein [Bradyrhizobium sp. CSA207]